MVVQTEGGRGSMWTSAEASGKGFDFLIETDSC